MTIFSYYALCSDEIIIFIYLELILKLPLVGHFDVSVDGISQSGQVDRFPSGFLEILLLVG